ncbi:MAG: hypothetical protein ACTID3_08570 [Halomonas sp.]|uniref:hypothetical protein n=1 Tax=Halomonas TaxID=2745 RepID=UPI00186777B2|nr:hypothetical protein [Halomonas colorata]
MSNDNPILVIQQEEHMSRASIGRVYEMADQLQQSLGIKVAFIEKGLSAQVEHGTADLVAAMHAQTAAINRLAESNQQVIDYLLSQEAEETGADLEGPSYLDPND